MDLVFYQVGLSVTTQKGKKGNKFHKFTFLKSIPGDLMKLVERMARVCIAIIMAKGGYLKNLKYHLYF